MKRLLILALAIISYPAFADSAPKNWEAEAEAFLKRGLKDPGSAQFEGWKLVKPPVSWTLETGVGEPTLKFSGHQVCVRMNAKNSFGGYVGFEDRIVLLGRDGNQDFVIYEAAQLRIRKAQTKQMTPAWYEKAPTKYEDMLVYMKASFPELIAAEDRNTAAAAEIKARCDSI